MSMKVPKLYAPSKCYSVDLNTKFRPNPFSSYGQETCGRMDGLCKRPHYEFLCSILANNA